MASQASGRQLRPATDSTVCIPNCGAGRVTKLNKSKKEIAKSTMAADRHLGRSGFPSAKRIRLPRQREPRSPWSGRQKLTEVCPASIAVAERTARKQGEDKRKVHHQGRATSLITVPDRKERQDPKGNAIPRNARKCPPAIPGRTSTRSVGVAVIPQLRTVITATGRALFQRILGPALYGERRDATLAGSTVI